MKKRIVCALLALILLVGMVPVTAITAAAAGTSMSESAITILKSWEKYSSKCDSKGYIGYGTKCTGKGAHGSHVMYEKEADAALRKVLAELDTAVNNFAGKYGLSLTQSQHDALVLFSFENGTAWTTGTGDFQTAIKNRSTGTTFLDAVCKWNYGIADDDRRMVEANMYLNGVYNTKAPSRFIRVTLNAGNGAMDEDELQYYDTLSSSEIGIKPTPDSAKQSFLGWYTADGQRVIKLTKDHDGKTLTAKYQKGKDGVTASYTIKKSALVSTTVYFEPNGEKKTKYVNEKDQEVTIKLADELNVIADYVDSKGVHWAKIADKKDCVIGWVKVSGSAASAGEGATMDVTVSVTNAYVNMRQKASIYSTKVGTRNYGDKLRILNTKSADGFVWGQVAKSASDATTAGWVALMYTDYETVKNQSSGSTFTPVVSGTVVAKATIIYNGYVNVRSDAGTHNTIVGSLAYGTTVDLYETTYVNGIKWGRCSSGWFCLNSYAKVETLVNDTNTNEAGFASYVFNITLKGTKVYPDEVFRVSPYDTSDFVEPIKKNNKRQALESTKVVVSNLINRTGDTWAKSEYGWIKLFDASGNLDGTYIKKFENAKFNVIADNVTVRANPENGAARLDVLIKGVEVLVSRIVVDKTGSTVWGYADKVGEQEPTYKGWINLATKNVSRIGAPVVSNGVTGTTGGTAAAAGTVATVINTTTVRVRKAASITATQIGSLSNGSTYAVLAEKDGWYKLDVDTDSNPATDSWVFGQYLDVKAGTTGSTGSSGTASGTTETGMGIVANTYSGVNIRNGAGTGFAAIGKYLPGTNVEILEVTTNGASKWGRTEKGWVCMDYIAMVSNYIPENGTNAGNGSNGSVVDTTVAIYTGYVNGQTPVYKAPHASESGNYNSDYQIRTLNAKDPVTVHELITFVEYEDKEIDKEDNDDGVIIQTEKKTTYWARINDGYIVSPGDAITLHALDEVVYTANEAVGELSGDEINLSANENVIVTNVRIVKNVLQGQVEYKDGKKAWFDLSKFTKGTVAAPKEEAPESNTNTGNTSTNTGSGNTTTPVFGSTGSTGNPNGGFVNNTSGYLYTGKVINTNQVNVRATASTTAKLTTTLKKGASLVIYETVISENMAWGRCDAGWIYLYYVDLTPAGNGAVDARVVYNDNTIVYTDMNGSGVAGSYAKMSVIDIYEIVGNMARTELGWVSTDDLL